MHDFMSEKQVGILQIQMDHIVFESSYQDGTVWEIWWWWSDADMTHDHFTELSEGCYTFNAYDSFGDGQTGYSGSGAGTDGSISL